MGKTPKKAAPGGDERDLYVRRQKATTAPSKASETSSAERQRESDNSNRPKLGGVQKRIPTAQGKPLKKPSAVNQPGLNRPRPGRPPLCTKDKKPSQSALLVKSAKEKVANMQPEAEEAELKLQVSIQKESNEQTIVNKDISDGINNKVSGEQTLVERPLVPEKEAESKAEILNGSQEKPVEILHEENGTSHSGANQTRENEECEENNDIQLSFDVEASPVKPSEEKVKETETQEADKPEEVHVVHEGTKNGTCENEELQNESQKASQKEPQKESQKESQINIEPPSIDLTESKTSDVSEVLESPPQADIEKETPKDEAPSDISFVTYDSSIMLKDVQIKLNDCLKENSKLFDTTKDEISASMSEDRKNLSFGKTLRTISGRNSLSRMRHVTLREHRMSPNNSLYVNTSNISLQPDDNQDFKILRYSTGVSDTFSTNGTPSERKRKLDTSDWSPTKKQKTESENSFFSASISLLKGLRRPIQISTPTKESFKFTSTKLDISGLEDKEEEPKIVTGPIEGTKKWCVIM